MPERCVAALCNNVNDPENNISLHRRFLNLIHRHQSRGYFEHVILVISGRGRPQENRILNFVKNRKKRKCVLSKSKNFFLQKFIRWNVELDERKKKIDIISTVIFATFNYSWGLLDPSLPPFLTQIFLTVCHTMYSKWSLKCCWVLMTSRENAL